MRPNARNVVLGLVVLVLALANVLLVEQREPAPEVRRLFPELAPEEAARVVVTAPDGSSLTLEREPDAERWTVAERFDHAAYAPLVERLLRGLATATDSERETTSRASHAALGVDDAAGVQLRIEDATGRAVVSAVQGAPPVGGRGSRLRLEGRDEVHRTVTVPRVDADPTRWIDPDVLPLDLSAATALELELTAEQEPTRAARLTRAEDGRFRVEPGDGGPPRQVVPRLVDPLLQALGSLVARDVVAAPESEPAGFGLRVALELPDGGEAELAFAPVGVGPPEADGALVRRTGVEAGGEERWFVVPRASEARLRALVARALDDG